MFTVGMPLAGEMFFMFATMMISVPFNWIATMWRGSMTFETPMLFAVGFLVMFTIGGLSGLMLAITPADIQYHDTYFVVALFFPMHFVGLAGMPRRIPDYNLQFADWNAVASIGAFGFGFSQLIFVWVVLKCIKGGEKATDEVWEGADGLEWTVPSPAPYHTFEKPPAQYS